MKQLYINGTGTGSLNIFITSDTFLNAPEYDYDAYGIPAVNGDMLKYNKRLKNIIRKFEGFCKKNVDANMDAFKKLIYSTSGYMKISSDYEPTTYQWGYLAQEIECEPFDASGAYEVKFTVYFSCMPQKYFVTANTVTSNLSQANPCDRVLTREHPVIQKMISKLPLAAIPESYYFAYFETPNPKTPFTLSLSITDLSFAAFCGLNWNSVTYELKSLHTLFAYTKGTPIENLSCTYSTPTPMTYGVIVALEKGSFTYTINPTSDGSSATATEQVMSGDTVTVTQATAVGASPMFTWEIQLPTVSEERGDYYAKLTGFSNGAETWQALVAFQFGMMPSSVVTLLNKTYATAKSGYTYKFMNVVYDPDLEQFYALKSGKKYSLDEYISVYGDIGGTCDTITIDKQNIVNIESWALTLKTKANWWKI